MIATPSSSVTSKKTITRLDKIPSSEKNSQDWIRGVKRFKKSNPKV